MESALLISSNDKGTKSFLPLLEELRFSPIELAASAGEARRKLSQRSFSLVVVNAPFHGESGEELALYASEKLLCGVLLLVRQENLEMTLRRCQGAGFLTLGKPIGRQAFLQAAQLTMVSGKKLLALQAENQSLRERMEELRLIGMAKCALIEFRGMTEPQAHRYIEKQAMDQRITKKEVAQEIMEAHRP